jgi:hypothetical protein
MKSMLINTWLWTGILADQLPCVLGVPNCAR